MLRGGNRARWSLRRDDGSRNPRFDFFGTRQGGLGRPTSLSNPLTDLPGHWAALVQVWRRHVRCPPDAPKVARLAASRAGAATPIPADPTVDALRYLVEEHFRKERQLSFYAGKLATE
jgi:hypothetical protein